ncbi:hypothetical protein PMKS-001356 [Pichia membranifaciens]|uniref:RecA family profile 1 domain-containing protein n=1 Tax=Pichia membranifaciens TaxID=4926 RepID=A0A1Q2YEF1_9ASCO|nr:hypothetical protein PMKS-001356 [Pichia membranifaciens]
MDLTKYCADSSFILNKPYCESLLNTFRNNQITTPELLLSSITTVARKLNRTESEIFTFIDKYETETCDRIVKSLHKPIPFLTEKNDETLTVEPTLFSVGDESIDNILNGGIPTGYLIELSGKSASGKTNFLLTLSVTIQLPMEFGGLGPSIFSTETTNHVGVKTMYIPTESPLATQRLKQIIDSFTELLETNGISYDNQIFFPKLDNVLTTSNVMTNLEEQDHILRYQLPVMLERDPSIKLLIIDSLTHHVRAQLTWAEQRSYVQSLCAYLKGLAKQYNISIMVANQVTDKPVRGLYSGDNDVLWKLNTEYQLGWMNGWDDIGIMYRQLMRREGVIDEAGKSFERLDYLNDIQTGSYSNLSQREADSYSSESHYDSKSQITMKNDLQNILKSEQKRLFDSNYKVKVSGIGTRPALGLALLEYIDMRIVLSKEYVPIFDEKLIDEFSVELGIDTSNLEDSFVSESSNSLQNSSVPFETSTQRVDQKQIVKTIANNRYLKNYNFESFRSLRCVFGPLIPAGETRKAEFEIWKGGIRKYIR